MDEKPSVSQLARRHGGHRERIFTEPVMELLIEQLGRHYYRIRDHLEKPQAVVTEIADYINDKMPGLQLQPMQVYGRMINLQNSLRRYWESLAVGEAKKKPRFYESLCKVFGTDYNAAAGAGPSDHFINGGEVLDGGATNHITVELPEFFDATTLASPYTTAHAPNATTSTPGRGDAWSTALTRVLVGAVEDALPLLRRRPEKSKAWRSITAAVNAHCSPHPLSLYQVKMKVRRMLAAVRKYERQASRGQLFVVKPFYYDKMRLFFKKELGPFQRTVNVGPPDAQHSHGVRGSRGLTATMTSYMRRSSALLEESVQIQRDMRHDLHDFHAKLLEQFRVFNDTYRAAVAARRVDDEEEVEEDYEDAFIVDETSDIEEEDDDEEEGIIEQDDYGEETGNVNSGHHDGIQ